MKKKIILNDEYKSIKFSDKFLLIFIIICYLKFLCKKRYIYALHKMLLFDIYFVIT